MTTSHSDEIDRAVALARRAATAGRTAGTEKLTRLLYQRWYLGKVPSGTPLPRQHARGPAPLLAPGKAPERAAGKAPGRPQWRSWGPLWTEDRTFRGADLVRLHLACAPHTSLHAVAVATARAVDWPHPWLLTSRALDQALPAPDATVLYLPAEALDDLRGHVVSLVEELQPFLASGAPALTLRVGRGASLAQNPPDGSSFGQHRCALIAQAVLANLDQPHREVVHRTLNHFRDAGVDPSHPYRALDARWQWSRRSLAA